MTTRPGPLGQRLATELRAELGRQNKSRRWLAEQLAIPHNTLSRWLAGDTCLPIDTCAGICDTLGIDMVELVAAVKYRVDVEQGRRTDRRAHPPKAWGRRPPPVLQCVAA